MYLTLTYDTAISFLSNEQRFATISHCIFYLLTIQYYVQPFIVKIASCLFINIEEMS